MTHRLPPVDPHDPNITAVELARHLDDLVRALNYATRPGDPRLGNAPDAYSVLGALREALGKVAPGVQPDRCAAAYPRLPRKLAG